MLPRATSLITIFLGPIRGLGAFNNVLGQILSWVWVFCFQKYIFPNPNFDFPDIECLKTSLVWYSDSPKHLASKMYGFKTLLSLITQPGFWSSDIQFLDLDLLYSKHLKSELVRILDRSLLSHFQTTKNVRNPN